MSQYVDTGRRNKNGKMIRRLAKPIAEEYQGGMDQIISKMMKKWEVEAQVKLTKAAKEKAAEMGVEV